MQSNKGTSGANNQNNQNNDRAQSWLQRDRTNMLLVAGPSHFQGYDSRELPPQRRSVLDSPVLPESSMSRAFFVTQATFHHEPLQTTPSISPQDLPAVTLMSPPIATSITSLEHQFNHEHSVRGGYHGGRQ